MLDRDRAMFIWLMQGDPAIRWQMLRDVLDAPARRWQLEQRRVAHTGWGARFLALQADDGRWGRGLYLPKWTSTTYTLLTLRDLGLPGSNRAAHRGARLLLDNMLGPTGSALFAQRLGRLDLCVAGMLLSLTARFAPRDPRRPALRAHVLARQMADGGWNCDAHKPRGAVHGSFHTTFNVLDGLQDDVEQGAAAAEIAVARGRALEFMLVHRLFRSHRTGEVSNPAFLKFSFPPRWHYDVLRGLDFFQRVRAPRDARLAEAIDHLGRKRRADGTWSLQNRYAGRDFFAMEQPGQPSRWNTLRALRVLRWWEDDALRN